MLKNFLEKITPLWDSFLEKPFLKKLILGDLDKNIFLKYLIQDTLYLKDYVKGYAFLFTKSDDINLMRGFLDCMKIIDEDETAVHIKYLKDFSYSEGAALSSSLAKINKSYLEFMIDKCKTGSLAQGLASLLPCAYSYYHVFYKCKIMAENLKTLKNNYYKGYIDFYSGKQYAVALSHMSEICSAVFSDCEENAESLYNIFVKSSEFEGKFWDMPFYV